MKAETTRELQQVLGIKSKFAYDVMTGRIAYLAGIEHFDQFCDFSKGEFDFDHLLNLQKYPLGIGVELYSSAGLLLEGIATTDIISIDVHYTDKLSERKADSRIGKAVSKEMVFGSNSIALANLIGVKNDYQCVNPPDMLLSITCRHESDEERVIVFAMSYSGLKHVEKFMIRHFPVQFKRYKE
jgi:hypothetical protein